MTENNTHLPRAAANGPLDRRFFLRSAAAGATAALTTPRLLAVNQDSILTISMPNRDGFINALDDNTEQYLYPPAGHKP